MSSKASRQTVLISRQCRVADAVPAEKDWLECSVSGRRLIRCWTPNMIISTNFERNWRRHVSSQKLPERYEEEDVLNRVTWIPCWCCTWPSSSLSNDAVWFLFTWSISHFNMVAVGRLMHYTSVILQNKRKMIFQKGVCPLKCRFSLVLFV